MFGRHLYFKLELANELSLKRYNRCCMCKNCGEMLDHLLLHSVATRELWLLALSLFGVHWVTRLVLEVFC
jgi:hypothetical protein